MERSRPQYVAYVGLLRYLYAATKNLMPRRLDLNAKLQALE